MSDGNRARSDTEFYAQRDAADRVPVQRTAAWVTPELAQLLASARDLATVEQRARRQAELRPPDWRGRPYKVWRAEERKYTLMMDVDRMMRKAPYPPKRTARAWNLRGPRTSYAACDPLAYLVGRNPQSFTRTDQIEW